MWIKRRVERRTELPRTPAEASSRTRAAAWSSAVLPSALSVGTLVIGEFFNVTQNKVKDMGLELSHPSRKARMRKTDSDAYLNV